MKEKALMTSCFVANWADIATTAYWVQHEGREIGIVGSGMIENFPQAMVYRTATTVFLLGIYALTQHRRKEFAFVGEKALKISHWIMWGVAAFNALETVPGVQETIAGVLQKVVR